MTTTEKMIIQRVYDTDIETMIELPQMPLDGDVIVIPRDEIGLTGTGDTISVQVLNVRMRFNLETGTDETEIITEIIDE